MSYSVLAAVMSWHVMSWNVMSWNVMHRSLMHGSLMHGNLIHWNLVILGAVDVWLDISYIKLWVGNIDMSHWLVSFLLVSALVIVMLRVDIVAKLTVPEGS